MIALASVLLLSSLTRSEFHAREQTLRLGATQEEVRRLLGPPDDVLTEHDPDLMESCLRQRWAYGTNGHGTFATLGMVDFVESGVYGLPDQASATEQVPDVDESTLRKALRAFDRYCPSFENSEIVDLDPLSTIRAAIELQPLGKHAVIDCAREYAKTNNPEFAFSVIQLLFDLPPGHDGNNPTFGSLVENDVPLPLRPEPHRAFHVFVGSMRAVLSRFLDRCEVYGNFRANPIAPALSRQLLLGAHDSVSMALLLRSVYDVGDPWDPNFKDGMVSRFNQWLDSKPSVPKWDSRRRAFVEPGFPAFPERVRPRPWFTVWEPKALAKGKCRVIAGWVAKDVLRFELRYDDAVSLRGRIELRTAGPNPLRIASREFPVGSLCTTNPSLSDAHWGAADTSGEGRTLKVDQTTPLQLALVLPQQEVLGPVVRPQFQRRGN